MSIQYDRPVIEALMEGLSGFYRAAFRHRDTLAADYGACRGRYHRLASQIAALIQSAESALRNAQADYQSARSELADAQNAANNAENDADRRSAESGARQARQKMEQAQRDMEKARADLARHEAKLTRLNSAWDAHSPAAQTRLDALDREFQESAPIVQNANQDLEQFMRHMEQVRGDLYGSHSGTSGTSSGAVAAGAGMGIAAGAGSASGGAAGSYGAPGWGPKNSKTAVTVDSGGAKNLSLSIGGTTRSFSCDKNGIAEAYRAAVDAGDADMIARTSAMFEIETLRIDLDLQQGDPGFAQLGGYHRDVRQCDPVGYESHHIPARSVQDEKADWLPAISITHEDHKDTSSYTGKQNRVYEPLFPSRTPNLTYRDSISEKIAQGGSGYIEALRNEVWDLRVTTGHRYDDGISGFLDAVIDMLATRGIPGSK